MSESIEQENDRIGMETVKSLHDKMQSLMNEATGSLPYTGICMFTFFTDGDDVRIAHMSNMENANLTALMKEWIICQEKANGRDRIN